jgi:hypothetical protein
MLVSGRQNGFFFDDITPPVHAAAVASCAVTAAKARAHSVRVDLIVPACCSATTLTLACVYLCVRHARQCVPRWMHTGAHSHHAAAAAHCSWTCTALCTTRKLSNVVDDKPRGSELNVHGLTKIATLCAARCSPASGPADVATARPTLHPAIISWACSCVCSAKHLCKTSCTPNVSLLPAVCVLQAARPAAGWVAAAAWSASSWCRRCQMACSSWMCRRCVQQQQRSCKQHNQPQQPQQH